MSTGAVATAAVGPALARWVPEMALQLVVGVLLLVLGVLTAATDAVRGAVLAPVLGVALVAVTLTTLLVGSPPNRRR
ncbi:MAG: hypothetical protein ACRDTD_10020 [Pseudonocardiaceae bacterium]